MQKQISQEHKETLMRIFNKLTFNKLIDPLWIISIYAAIILNILCIASVIGIIKLCTNIFYL